MPKKQEISESQAQEIAAARKMNKNKNVDRRLKALEMRACGSKSEEIAKRCGYHPSHISKLVAIYLSQGLEGIVANHYKGNHRNMDIEEEEALLARYEKQAEQGEMVEVSTIKTAYEKAVGHRIGKGQIYYVLKRHGWRKLLPRSKHPNKASDEVIEASKKLTSEYVN